MPTATKSLEPNRQVNVSSIKSLFDELIDRHAEAYLSAYPELREFSKFEKSGTVNNYIGMVWLNNCEKPPTNVLKIRGSQSLTQNKLVELDLRAVKTEQAFFPGQIVAFVADPFLKEQLVVRRFLDPIGIAPPLKKINTVDKINLAIAAGPYMKPDQDDWTLFDKLIENVKSQNATHIVLIGPFIDVKNKFAINDFDKNWRLVYDKLAEGLYDHRCHVYIVPSDRDILPSDLQTDHFYPSTELNIRSRIKEGSKLKCVIKSVTDPAQIDLGGVYLDVTAAGLLLDAKNCMSTINRQPGNLIHQLNPIFKHVITHGIYPIYPPPVDMAIDFPKMHKYLNLDRLGAHIIVLPNIFSITPVFDVDTRIIVAVRKCCLTKQLIMLEIPIIESSEETPIDSLFYTNYNHRLIDLIENTSQNQGSSLESKADSLNDSKINFEQESKPSMQIKNNNGDSEADNKIEIKLGGDMQDENQMEVVSQ